MLSQEHLFVCKRRRSLIYLKTGLIVRRKRVSSVAGVVVREESVALRTLHPARDYGPTGCRDEEQEEEHVELSCSQSPLRAPVQSIDCNSITRDTTKLTSFHNAKTLNIPQRSIKFALILCVVLIRPIPRHYTEFNIIIKKYYREKLLLEDRSFNYR